MNILLKKVSIGCAKKSFFLQLKLLSLGISAYILLALSHIDSVGLSWSSVKSVITYIPRVLLVTSYDGLYILTITLFFFSISYLAGNKRRYKTLIYYAYYFVILTSLIISYLNISFIKAAGKPFTFQWLYYSDFLGSTDALNAIKANLNWKLLRDLCLICIIIALGSRVLLVLISNLSRRLTSVKYNLAGLAFIVIIYGFLFNHYKNDYKLNSEKYANSVVFFFESLNLASDKHELFTMKVPRGIQDEFKTTGVQEQNKHIVSSNFHDNNIKNVILFVLESVPASYIDLYGGKYQVTPQLDKLAGGSVWFKNMYAHTPSTPYAMVSLLSSLYPVISYEGITATHPEIDIPTISSELKNYNYKTAFFNAGDIRFQHADKFLKHQQFDLIEDYRSDHCKKRQYIVQKNRWDNPDGSDDECMIDSFNEWVSQIAGNRFFTTMWTVQTHYPYFFSGKEKHFSTCDDVYCKNRYLNAIYHSDETLGKLMQILKKRDLDKSTLVVVVGDHGEAFGQHNQYGHASKIYEENVHIPLFFINQELFKGEQEDILGSQIDIAPTIMDILHYPIPSTWQGMSLFDNTTTKKKRIYFFSPWSDFLFGYREGNTKYIFNATNNSDEVYNLLIDSLETNNIASTIPRDSLLRSHQYLASWIQYQSKFIRQTLLNKTN